MGDEFGAGRRRWFDKTGKPVSLLEYATLQEDVDYLRVAKAKIGQATVSTVWLGRDHGFGGDPPLIFETKVFTSAEDDDMGGLGDLDDFTRRYPTEADALVGHEDVCELIRAMSGGVLEE